MKYEDKILKNALAEYASANRIPMESNVKESLTADLPFRGQKGFDLDQIANLVTNYINWINSIPSTDRVVVLDNITIDVANLKVPELLKEMIWPQEILVDPASSYSIDLIDREKFQSIKYDNILLALKAWNMVVYGSRDFDTHMVNLSDVRTTTSLLNVITKCSVKDRCVRNDHGNFLIPLKDVSNIFVVNGYFDDTIDHNNELLNSKFKITI